MIATAMPLQADYAASWAFLRQLHADRPVVVTAIPLTGKRGALPTQSFRKDEEARFLEWITAAAAMPANLYYSVGEPIAANVTKRLNRAGIRNVRWLHVDVDPRAGEPLEAEQARILALLDSPPNDIPAPTAIVFSGNGYQALWKLAEPIVIDGDTMKADDAALYNLALERAFNADACHDVSRILRLPGTINLPNDNKRKRGRQPALARLVSFDESRVYPLERFTKAAPSQPADAPAASTIEVRTIAHPDDLGDAVSDAVKIHIVNGCNPDDPQHFASRSEGLYWAVCELLRAGTDESLILGILLDPQFKISESVLEKGKGAERYARRQLERARHAVSQENVSFQTDDKGNPYKTPHNIRVSIIKQGVKLWYDEFADKKYIEGLEGFGPVVDDKALIRLWVNAMQKYRLHVPKTMFFDITSDFALADRRHPVREYLEELKWDGTSRIETWLQDYAGVADSPYVRAVSRLSLIAAVRRVRKPGCKFDEMIVLEGLQGGGKSTLLEKLCPDDNWFLDDLPLVGKTQQLMEMISGKWIVESSELKDLKKAKAENLKAMLSRRVDRARLAWRYEPVDMPRQCIFFGTTNNETYLKDATGNRRFWPVKTSGAMREAELAAVRDLLWAEAAYWESQGVSIRLDPSLYSQAASEQAARMEVDSMHEVLSEVLEGQTGKVKAHDVWTIIGKSDPGLRRQEDMKRLGDTMRMLGWTRKQLRFNGKVEYAYVKGTEAQQKQALILNTVEGSRTLEPEGTLPSYNEIPF